MQVNWKLTLVIAALAILAFVAYRKWRETQTPATVPPEV